MSEKYILHHTPKKRNVAVQKTKFLLMFCIKENSCTLCDMKKVLLTKKDTLSPPQRSNGWPLTERFAAPKGHLPYFSYSAINAYLLLACLTREIGCRSQTFFYQYRVQGSWDYVRDRTIVRQVLNLFYRIMWRSEKALAACMYKQIWLSSYLKKDCHSQ